VKIQADTSSTLNLIGAINSGAVSVGGKTVTGSFIITPTDPVCRWQIKDFGELTGTLLEDLFSSGREILLVGTGRVHHFPGAHLLQMIATQQYGVEFMSSLAACRTFNILALEGRAVSAAVILPL
jgi:uncharacterized protein|tara:strand:- start:1454 stop:1828 length:375 start_codon:yes stop_codon:yes gene_type:complete